MVFEKRSSPLISAGGPNRIAKSTGKPDRRQHDNKKTPGNTPSLKPNHHKKGD